MSTTIPQWRRDSLKKALAECPRSPAGDPQFADLKQLEVFFTHSEIAWLVNRALYQEEYQAQYHKKRAEQRKEQRSSAKHTPPTPARSAEEEKPRAHATLRINRKMRTVEDLSDSEVDALVDILSQEILSDGIATEEEVQREERLANAFARRPTNEMGS